MDVAAQVSEIAQNPHGELCWYFPETREQYRVAGRLRVVTEACEEPDAKKVSPALTAAWTPGTSATRVHAACWSCSWRDHACMRARRRPSLMPASPALVSGSAQAVSFWPGTHLHAARASCSPRHAADMAVGSCLSGAHACMHAPAASAPPRPPRACGALCQRAVHHHACSVWWISATIICTTHGVPASASLCCARTATGAPGRMEQHVGAQPLHVLVAAAGPAARHLRAERV